MDKRKTILTIFFILLLVPALSHASTDASDLPNSETLVSLYDFSKEHGENSNGDKVIDRSGNGNEADIGYRAFSFDNNGDGLRVVKRNGEERRIAEINLSSSDNNNNVVFSDGNQVVAVSNGGTGGTNVALYDAENEKVLWKENVCDYEVSNCGSIDSLSINDEEKHVIASSNAGDTYAFDFQGNNVYAGSTGLKDVSEKASDDGDLYGVRSDTTNAYPVKVSWDGTSYTVSNLNTDDEWTDVYYDKKGDRLFYGNADRVSKVNKTSGETIWNNNQVGVDKLDSIFSSGEKELYVSNASTIYELNSIGNLVDSVNENTKVEYVDEDGNIFFEDGNVGTVEQIKSANIDSGFNLNSINVDENDSIDVFEGYDELDNENIQYYFEFKTNTSITNNVGYLDSLSDRASTQGSLNGLEEDWLYSGFSSVIYEIEQRGDHAYSVDFNTQVAKVDKDGNEVWKKEVYPDYIGGEIKPGVDSSGNVYVPNDGSNITKLDSDGNVVWNNEYPYTIRSVKAKDGYIYALGEIVSIGVVKINASTGTEVGSVTMSGSTGNYADAEFHPSKDYLYMTDWWRTLTKVNITDMTKEWETKFTNFGNGLNKIAVDKDGNFYYYFQDNGLLAKYDDSRNQIWNTTEFGSISGMSYDDGKIYAGSTNNYVNVINPDDGSEITQSQSYSEIIRDVEVSSDGKIYTAHGGDGIRRFSNSYEMIFPDEPNVTLEEGATITSDVALDDKAVDLTSGSTSVVSDDNPAINLGHPNLLKSGDVDFTLTSWYKLNSFGQSRQTLFSSEATVDGSITNTTNSSGMQVSLTSDDKLELEIGGFDQGSSIVETVSLSDVSIEPSKWFMLGVERRGDTVEVFINGRRELMAQDSRISQSTFLGSGDEKQTYTIGATYEYNEAQSQTGYRDSVDGYVDNIRIFEENDGGEIGKQVQYFSEQTSNTGNVTSVSVDSQSGYESGTYERTSTDRDDNSGRLGLGYTYANNSYSWLPQNNNVLGQWELSENFGTSSNGDTVPDRSGNGNSGTTNGGVDTTANGPFSTSAYRFDGNDDYITGTIGPSGNTDFAVSLWVNLDEHEQNKYFYYQGNSNGGETFALDNPTSANNDFSNDGSLRLSDFSSSLEIDRNVLPTNEWTHIYAVHETDGTREIYVNSNLEGSDTGSTNPSWSTQNGYIGAKNKGSGPERHPDGSISNVQVFNTALSQSEIEELYLQGQDGTFNGNYQSNNLRSGKDSTIAWEKLKVSTNLKSQDINATVEISDDNFSTVLDSQTFTNVQDGENTFGISNLQNGDDVRVRYDFTTTDVTQTPEVTSYEINDESGTIATESRITLSDLYSNVDWSTVETTIPLQNGEKTTLKGWNASQTYKDDTIEVLHNQNSNTYEIILKSASDTYYDNVTVTFNKTDNTKVRETFYVENRKQTSRENLITQWTKNVIEGLSLSLPYPDEDSLFLKEGNQENEWVRINEEGTIQNTINDVSSTFGLQEGQLQGFYEPRINDDLLYLTSQEDLATINLKKDLNSNAVVNQVNNGFGNQYNFLTPVKGQNNDYIVATTQYGDMNIHDTNGDIAEAGAGGGRIKAMDSDYDDELVALTDVFVDQLDIVRYSDFTSNGFNSETIASSESFVVDAEEDKNPRRYFDGFESGTLNAFTVNENGFDIRTDKTYEGSYSAGMTTGSTNNDVLASTSPTIIEGGQRVDEISYYYRETGDSTGGGMRLLTSDGDPVITTSTDNPEWDIVDNNGVNEVDGGSNYKQWHRVNMTFDWSAETVDVYWKNVESGRSGSYTDRPMINSKDVGTIELVNYNGGVTSGTKFHQWYDNINVEVGSNERNVYVVGVNGVEAYDLNGDMQWSDNEINGTSRSQVSVEYSDGSVYAASKTGLKKYDAITGVEEGNYSASWVEPKINVNGDKVYVSNVDDNAGEQTVHTFNTDLNKLSTSQTISAGGFSSFRSFFSFNEPVADAKSKNAFELAKIPYDGTPSNISTIDISIDRTLSNSRTMDVYIYNTDLDTVIGESTLEVKSNNDNTVFELPNTINVSGKEDNQFHVYVEPIVTKQQATYELLNFTYATNSETENVEDVNTLDYKYASSQGVTLEGLNPERTGVKVDTTIPTTDIQDLTLEIQAKPSSSSVYTTLESLSVSSGDTVTREYETKNTVLEKDEFNSIRGVLKFENSLGQQTSYGSSSQIGIRNLKNNFGLKDNMEDLMGLDKNKIYFEAHGGNGCSARISYNQEYTETSANTDGSCERHVGTKDALNMSNYNSITFDYSVSANNLHSGNPGRVGIIAPDEKSSGLSNANDKYSIVEGSGTNGRVVKTLDVSNVDGMYYVQWQNYAFPPSYETASSSVKMYNVYGASTTDIDVTSNDEEKREKLGAELIGNIGQTSNPGYTGYFEYRPQGDTNWTSTGIRNLSGENLQYTTSLDANNNIVEGTTYEWRPAVNYTSNGIDKKRTGLTQTYTPTNFSDRMQSVDAMNQVFNGSSTSTFFPSHYSDDGNADATGLSYNEDHIYMEGRNEEFYTGTNVQQVRTENPLNMSRYNTLYFDIAVPNMAGGGSPSAEVGLLTKDSVSNNRKPSQDGTSYLSFTSQNQTKRTVELDVSNQTGNYYVGFAADSGGDARTDKTSLEVYNMYGVDPEQTELFTPGDKDIVRGSVEDFELGYGFKKSQGSTATLSLQNNGVGVFSNDFTDNETYNANRTISALASSHQSVNKDYGYMFDERGVQNFTYRINIPGDNVDVTKEFTYNVTDRVELNNADIVPKTKSQLQTNDGAIARVDVNETYGSLGINWSIEVNGEVEYEGFVESVGESGTVELTSLSEDDISTGEKLYLYAEPVTQYNPNVQSGAESGSDVKTVFGSDERGGGGAGSSEAETVQEMTEFNVSNVEYFVDVEERGDEFVGTFTVENSGERDVRLNGELQGGDVDLFEFTSPLTNEVVVQGSSREFEVVADVPESLEEGRYTSSVVLTDDFSDVSSSGDVELVVASESSQFQELMVTELAVVDTGEMSFSTIADGSEPLSGEGGVPIRVAHVVIVLLGLVGIFFWRVVISR